MGENLVLYDLREIDTLSAFQKINAEIDTIFLKENSIEIPTKNYGIVLLDNEMDLNYQTAKSHLLKSSFNKATTEILPGLFERGKTNTWFYFVIKNVAKDTLFPLINGNLSQDSLWVFDQNALIKAEKFPAYYFDSISQKYYPSANDYKNLPMAPGAVYGFLLKQYDFSYSDQGLFPTASNAENLNTVLINYFQSLKYFYFFSISLIIGLILIFGFQIIFYRDKTLILYCAYLVVNILIVWRNMEDLDPYFLSTKLYLSWDDTKIFHTALFFITYTTFILEFLNHKPLLLKRIIQIIIFTSIVVMIVELPLQNYSGYYSWVLYYWYRVFVTILGIIAIFGVWKSVGRLSKYILFGSLALVISEVISWFFVDQTLSSVISLTGVLLELVIFALAMGIRFKNFITGFYTLQLENLQKEKEKELAVSNLKSRIAQDIHDDVGAELTKIVLTSHLLINNHQIPKSELDQKLAKISIGSITAGAKLKDLVFSINPENDHVDQLHIYLRETAVDLWQDQDMKLNFNFFPEGKNYEIDGFARSQLVMLYKELLTNISKHANAKNVWVDFQIIDGNSYLLSVKDDGEGFDVDKSSLLGNGLKNIHTRCQRINAQLTINSQINKGTAVTIKGSDGLSIINIPTV